MIQSYTCPNGCCDVHIERHGGKYTVEIDGEIFDGFGEMGETGRYGNDSAGALWARANRQQCLKTIFQSLPFQRKGAALPSVQLINQFLRVMTCKA